MCPYLNTAISVLIVLWARGLMTNGEPVTRTLTVLKPTVETWTTRRHLSKSIVSFNLVSLWVMFYVFIGYVNKCLLLAAWRTKIKWTSRFKIVQFLIFSYTIKSTFWWERQRECKLVSMSVIKSLPTSQIYPGSVYGLPPSFSPLLPHTETPHHTHTSSLPFPP